MNRAALLIGVKKTGGLAPLQAVGSGIAAVAEWAKMQESCGMKSVRVLSDANDSLGRPSTTEAMSAVTALDISNAIAESIAGGAEQLFVYFAGHGANVRYNEIWLLSGAPEKANEAVNLDGSLKLARQCGLSHVVVISDACRTAASTIQAQSVEGSLIFPNRPPSGRPGHVDVFYATIVSRPALEVSKPGTEGYEALYTRSIVDGLLGKAEVDVAQERGQSVARVKPWPLQAYLDEAVPALLTTLGASLDVNQTPDAIITSPPTAWLSQLPPPKTETGGAAAVLEPPKRRGARAPDGGSSAAPAPASRPKSLRSDLTRRLSEAMSSPKRRMMRGGGGAASTPLEWLDDETRSIVFPDPTHHPFVGFVIRGAVVRSALVARGSVIRQGRNFIDVHARDGRASNVLIEFDSGHGVLLPAIQNYVAELVFDENELAGVSYRSLIQSESAPRGARIDQARLASVVATASRLGVFHPGGAELADLRQYLNESGWRDPILAVYGAYAFDTQQWREAVVEADTAIKSSLGVRWFDLAMLARETGSSRHAMPDVVFPAVPLLAQGWALLAAYGVDLPKSLRDAGRHVASSQWTLFDEAGVAQVRAAITSNEIP